MQDVVIREAEIEIAAGRGLALPETLAQGDAGVIERLDRHPLVRARPAGLVHGAGALRRQRALDQRRQCGRSPQEIAPAKFLCHLPPPWNSTRTTAVSQPVDLEPELRHAGPAS